MATGWLIAGVILILLSCYMQDSAAERQDSRFGGKRFWLAVESMGICSMGIAAILVFIDLIGNAL